MSSSFKILPIAWSTRWSRRKWSPGFHKPAWISFCSLGSHPFSSEIFCLTVEIYILSWSASPELGRIDRGGALAMGLAWPERRGRQPGGEWRHTRSEGSHSMTNFCCFRSCEVDKRVSMHCPKRKPCGLFNASMSGRVDSQR